jgi:AraC family transcriptional regulator, regulatory protein of adaptative response / methylated-DNA-[protein]-cysteine methyltransferase
MIYYYTEPSILNEHTTVACTKQGVCAIIFATQEAVEVELKQMFPKEELYFGSVRSQNNTYKFVDRLASDLNFDQLPLDIISGTAFQQSVWRYLKEVPRGSTITYSELAVRVGRPKAVRAVASAVANNPISVIIPCHRVIPKSGGIGKYRWGSDMKKALLERELQ